MGNGRVIFGGHFLHNASSKLSLKNLTYNLALGLAMGMLRYPR